jgi:hypothetical protein
MPKYQKFNPVPLHKRTHFRRLRELLYNICKFDRVDTERYDFKHICCYQIHGRDLKGHDVSFKDWRGREYQKSFLLGNVTYDVYEVPSCSNTPRSPFGEFLVLMKCGAFPYWFLARLDVNTSGADWTLYGKYDISLTDRPTFRKTEMSDAVYRLDISWNQDDTSFDPLCVRYNSYNRGDSKQDSINKHIKNISVNKEKIANKNDHVKKYKHKKRTNNNVKKK